MPVSPPEIRNIERIERIDIPNIDISLLTPEERRIKKKYEILGGESVLGQPTSKLEGKMWTFANGSCICDNPEVYEAFEIHGAIYTKWLSLGGLNFGIPCTDETSTPDGIGRYNHFNNNACSIYWTPTTGAAAIWGQIREKWESLGWERSYLGYPISDEVDFSEGGRANEFQNGGIYWWPDTGAIDLRNVILNYTGLYCFGETDNDQSSGADEPYWILSISTPQIANTLNTQIYSDVDAGDSRPDLLEIYRGRPYGINIGVMLMENDYGDPNKYKEQIHQAVMGVHSAGTAALGLIPIVGPFIAAIAGPALGSLMPDVSSAINDLFDFGDDRLGAINITISAKQMILLATNPNINNFWGIEYKMETQLISADGSSYKGYFNIVPA